MPGPALWPIAIPGLTALAGVALGKWLDLAGERKRWLRDQSTRAYAEFNSTAEVLIVQMSQDDYPEMQANCLAAFARFAEAAALVDVFGNDAAVLKARDIWNFFNELLDDWSAFMAKDDAVWDENTAQYRTMMNEFTGAVRTSLGGTPLAGLARTSA